MAFKIQVVDPRPEVENIYGQYLKDFDFEANNGEGFGTFTSNIAEAKSFATMYDAITFIKTQPECRPLRDDGLPNRPMTAVSISVSNDEG